MTDEMTQSPLVWHDGRLELPDSDHWVVVSLGEGEDVDCALARLEFTDDSEGHGEPYWETRQGDLAICNYPFWVYVPGQAPE